MPEWVEGEQVEERRIEMRHFLMNPDLYMAVAVSSRQQQFDVMSSLSVSEFCDWLTVFYKMT